MAETIRLKHQYKSNMRLRMQYFYDGRAEVKFGIIELPVERTAWIERAFMLGFRVDPETDRPLELAEIKRRALGQVVITPPAAESTESAGEGNEGSDVGGQPVGEDGLRESEPQGDDSVPEAELGSGGSDGSGASATGLGSSLAEALFGGEVPQSPAGRPDGSGKGN